MWACRAGGGSGGWGGAGAGCGASVLPGGQLLTGLLVSAAWPGDRTGTAHGDMPTLPLRTQPPSSPSLGAQEATWAGAL